MGKQEGFTLWEQRARELGSQSKGLGVTVQGTEAEANSLKDTWEEAEQTIGTNVLGRANQGKEDGAGPWYVQGTGQVWCSWTGERRGWGRSGAEAQARAMSRRDPLTAGRKVGSLQGKEQPSKGLGSRNTIILHF